MPKLGGGAADAANFVVNSGGTGVPGTKGVVKSVVAELVEAHSGQFTPEKLAELLEKRDRKQRVELPKSKPRKKKEKPAEGAVAEGEAPGGSEDVTVSNDASGQAISAAASPARSAPEQAKDSEVIDLDYDETAEQPLAVSTPAKRSAEEAEFEAEPVPAEPVPAKDKGKGKQKPKKQPKPPPAKKVKRSEEGGPVLGEEQAKSDSQILQLGPDDGEPGRSEKEGEKEVEKDNAPVEAHFPEAGAAKFDRPEMPYTATPVSSATAALILSALPPPNSVPYGHQDAATLHTLVLDMTRRGPSVVLSDQNFYLQSLMGFRNVVDRIARSLREARGGFIGDYIDDLVVGPGKSSTFFDDLNAVLGVFRGTAGKVDEEEEEMGFRLLEDENDLGVDIRAVLVAIDEIAAQGASDSEDDEEDAMDVDFKP
jgi:hypothetical protein